MGKRGFIKQPEAIARLKNTWRKDRYKNNMETTEQNYLKSIPQPPPFLNGDGLELWNTMLVELILIDGLMTNKDLPEFGILCLHYQNMIESDRILQEKGKTITDTNGKSRTRPEWNIFNDSFKNYNLLCRNFGLDPASRSNIKLQSKVIEDDPLKAFSL